MKLMNKKNILKISLVLISILYFFIFVKYISNITFFTNFDEIIIQVIFVLYIILWIIPVTIIIDWKNTKKSYFCLLSFTIILISIFICEWILQNLYNEGDNFI